MMNHLEVLGRGLLSLVVLFSISKAMGRKQIGQLNLFDYTIGITIGSLAAEMTLNQDVKFFEGVFSIIIYGAASIFISLLTIKSMLARRLFIGTPFFLIQDGKILMKNLNRAKIDVNDLLQEARYNGYFDLSTVEYALMEANGRISFLLKSKYNPVTPSDMKLKVPYKGLTSTLVIDGVLMKENIKVIGHNEKWLLKRLQNEGYPSVEDLLLVICDTNEKLTIYPKNDVKINHTSLE